MDSADPIYDYLNLANSLFEGETSESGLPQAAALLPSLDETLLNRLADHAETLALTEPRRGWAVTQVAQVAASSHQSSLFVQSLAAWYLGRACNHWAQPNRVSASIGRARHGFEELHESGWVAACDWQLNALPWTRPVFTEAIRSLQRSLKKLEHAGFDEFVPHCRLALAYAQILTGKHKAAMKNIEASEVVFTAAGDQFNQARCWLHLASSLRRQDRFDAALDKLHEARDFFGKEKSPVDQARTDYQIALCHSLKADHLYESEAHFEKAAQVFQSLDLDLWLALCLSNLGLVLLLNGQLKLAGEHYQEARIIFERHEIPGLVADNLNDRGKWNILMGRPAISIEQFKQCEQINEDIGSRVQAAIAITNLGDAYGQLGRYQDALYHLERAVMRLKPLKNYFRVATCEKYMALVWNQLGQPETAHEHLDLAEVNYKKARQQAFLASVLNYRAAVFFQQGKITEAIESLQNAMRVAAKHDMRPQVALSKRLLGEALLLSGRTEEAFPPLEQARDECIEIGMQMEQAACMISIGSGYRLLSKPNKARSAFEGAIQLSEGSFHETDWRAHIELGKLAESEGNVSTALHRYRQAVEVFTGIRQNLLQPALAGSYLQAPARVFDSIVSTASKSATAEDTLYFLEAGKASTLLRHLSANGSWSGDIRSQELDRLRAEIHALQNQLRASMDEAQGIRSLIQGRQSRAQLVDKVRQYDVLKARLERQNLSEIAPFHPLKGFHLDFFRENASRALGINWIALDFYLTKEELVTVLLTPNECLVAQRFVSQRFTMALQACDRARRNAEPPLDGDLKVLGENLIPDKLAGLLSPNTHLLIVPHRQLHHVPWPALQTSFAPDPLVCLSAPSIHSSLHSLTLLWERARSSSTSALGALSRTAGLLVGLSSFNGTRKELPQVREEVSALRAKLDSNGRVLDEANATWENLLKLKDEESSSGRSLARFAWLHIASHFFTDRHTGRLSGMAMADSDIWLDQLRDLAPLPGLVTLSACNSNDSFLYEGDEHVDLQSTCFIAGANSVVGNTWPIPDRAASELILRFYDGYLSGQGPAQAAAQAQRQVIQRGAGLGDWASFGCAGMP